MYKLLETDEVLKKEKVELEKRLGNLLAKKHEIEDDLSEMYDLWRATKDPITKREIHKEIFKIKDTILHMNYGELYDVKCELGRINRLLNSYSTPVLGSIYNTYRDLDFNDIMNNGIHGVKL